MILLSRSVTTTATSIATAAIGKDIASHKELGLDVEEMNLDKAFEKIADLEAKIDALLSQHDEG